MAGNGNLLKLLYALGSAENSSREFQFHQWDVFSEQLSQRIRYCLQVEPTILDRVVPYCTTFLEIFKAAFEAINQQMEKHNHEVEMDVHVGNHFPHMYQASHVHVSGECHEISATNMHYQRFGPTSLCHGSCSITQPHIDRHFDDGGQKITPCAKAFTAIFMFIFVAFAIFIIYNIFNVGSL